MTKLIVHRKPAHSRRKSTSAQTNAVLQARRDTERYPKRPEGWKTLATLLLTADPTEAHTAARRALELAPDDPMVLDVAARAEAAIGNEPEAVELLKKACELAPTLAIAHTHLGILLYLRNKYEDALVSLNQALSLNPADPEALYHKGLTLFRLQHYDEADTIFHDLIERYPKSPVYWNEAGNVKRDLGLLADADEYYRQAEKFTGKDPVPLGNRITALHYRPDVTNDIIFEVCKEWQSRFAPSKPPARPVPDNLDPNRRLRIGMFSDGFRKHPVGSMTVRMLESRNPEEFEVFAYTTSPTEDTLTHRIKKAVQHWALISHLSDEQFAQRIRDDKIDILIDLSGYNRGNRMRVMAMQPAPLLVKWVGGLINTTGVTAIDYLISDSIETPPGVDHLYTEKLIRLPDDYICFDPPPILPDVGELPAARNGYITLGCFNNPLKVNEVILAQWAGIMQALPDSRLFLKGHQYASNDVCERIRRVMNEQGITADRLIFEGPSLQPILLNAYNRVDIALDPWPYSGGLTTCEAMIMGVPVVTLPGPTFAGRHSATHLINAGMPELVVNSWEEYRARVLELASDLDSLAVIRKHLRRILLESPVCDGPRFADNFTRAMRAIWQRYCEGKEPAALSISDRAVMFEDDVEPRQITLLKRPEEEADASEFSFQLTSQIITVDHGAQLATAGTLPPLLKTGAFYFVLLDPLGDAGSYNSIIDENLTYRSGIALGDGLPADLHIYLEHDLSGTVIRKPRHLGLVKNEPEPKPIATLPIQTIKLDQIEGLERADWIILDHRNSNIKIIEENIQSIRNALAIQVNASLFNEFNNYFEINNILLKQGFQPYDLINLKRSHVISDENIEKSTIPLETADVVYIPGQDRLRNLEAEELSKLAFLLHTCYGAYDTAYVLLKRMDAGQAELYRNSLMPQPSSTENRNRHTQKKKEITTKICVGIPVYNEEEYIEKAIQSLKLQSYDDVTFFISDNSSTDRTFEICCDLTHGDERFHLIQQENNIGAFGNFIFTLQNNLSAYFMWLGGHDHISPNYLESTIKHLENDGSLSMVCGQPYGFIDDSEPNIVSRAVYDFSQKNRVERYIESVKKLANCTILHSLFRKRDVRDMNFVEQISWDHILISHLLWKGKLFFVPDAYYFRRYFNDRTTTFDERITGIKNKKLDRRVFIDNYVEDFNNLCIRSRIKPDSHVITIRRILEERFQN